MRVFRKHWIMDNLPSLIRALSEWGISRSGRDGDGEQEELGEGAGSRGDHGVDNSMRKPALVLIQLSSSSESSRSGSPKV